MYKLIACFLGTLYLLPLYSCSTSNNIKPFTPVSAKTNTATIYIYRPSAMANAIYSPELYINGEMKFNLKADKKHLITLPPGESAFEIEPDKKYTGTTRLTLSLKANELYYLRLDTSIKIKNSSTYENYQRGFSLVKIDSAQAITEISACCNQGNRNLANKKSSESKQEKNSDGGFSTDKTHNPFSH